MPKVSFYELEHMTEESNFEKVRSKKSKQQKDGKHPEKKKHREKKVDFWEIAEDDDNEK